MTVIERVDRIQATAAAGIVQLAEHHGRPFSPEVLERARHVLSLWEAQQRERRHKPSGNPA